jgi:hypothetical protein
MRAGSATEAAALQTGIERFAKPWNRLRACRVFRDDASMSANAGLWSAIEGALTDSQCLILILSRAAAQSPYVDNEVRWWVEHKSPATVLLVHDDGTRAWDRVSNRFSADTDCVPPALLHAYAEEPRWLDLTWFDDPQSLGTSDPRFTGAIADLASPIRGIERDELIGENVAQHRKARRLARGGATVLAVLLGLAIIATAVATVQRYSIARQARTLQARQLAASAGKYLGTDLRLSELLAVEAYETEDSPVTYAALLGASVASPYLRGFHTFSADVRKLAASGGGTAVVAALSNGDVVAVRPRDLAHETRLFTMDASGDELAVSEDGGVVMATDHREAWLWTAAGGPTRVPLPPAPSDGEIKGVGVAADGHTGMVAWGYGDGTPASLSTFAVDELTGEGGQGSAITTRRDPGTHDRVVFMGDRRVNRPGFSGGSLL